MAWPDFYDPDLYEDDVGPGLRVEDAYAALLCGPALSIVEYGCGPGQVLLRLAADGHRVTGIDRVPAMVARARQRVGEAPGDVAGRITVLSAEIEAVVLPDPVDAVLLTNEFVLHVADAAALVAMLAVAGDALTPRGRLVLDLPHVNFALLSQASGPQRDLEFCRGYFSRGTGGTLRVIERIAFDPATWCKEMIFKYEEIDASGRATGTRFRKLVQRVWTLQEIRFALALAGFASIAAEIRPEFPDRQFVTAVKGEAT